MEQQEKSQVWLVNLEGGGLENKFGKYSKQMISEYSSGQKSAIMFPIGYVLKHPEGWNSYRVYRGFEKSTNLVPRAIYDNVDIGHLEGELLTVIDASFADKKQCEAIKSLVRQTIWRFNANQEERVLEVFKKS